MQDTWRGSPLPRFFPVPRLPRMRPFASQKVCPWQGLDIAS